jgi:uncharacterized membrane protein
MGALVFRDKETDPAFKTRIGQYAKGGMIMADIGCTLAIAGGVFMAVKGDMFHQRWLHLKMGLVLLVLAYHVFLRIRVKRAAQGTAGKFPMPLFPLLTLIGVGVLVTAIFKPFMG